MTLAQLKNVVAAYFGKATSDLTVNTVDLFLVAANNARKNAELAHNFEYTRTTATLDIVGVSGGNLNAAVLDVANSFASLREVTSITRTNSSGYRIPLDFTRLDVAVERERSELELDNDYWPSVRYPSDQQVLNRTGGATVTQAGRMLYVYPFPVDAQTISLHLLGYGDLADYTATNLTDSAPTDFIVDKGFKYLQWSCIVELNYLFRRFVPREEGNLASPEKLMAQALSDLILWDNFLVDPNVTRSR